MNREKLGTAGLNRAAQIVVVHLTPMTLRFVHTRSFSFMRQKFNTPLAARAIALTLALAVLTACGQGQSNRAADVTSESAVSTSPETTDAASASGSADAISAKQALANYLQEIDATMYGAYWCPHCADQKAMFGDAASTLNYVECDPEGENAQPQRCRDAGIEGFPTWKINGELYPGVQSLEQLATLSGYDGPHDFE